MKKNGYVALYSVLIISMIASVIAVSLLFTGLQSATISKKIGYQATSRGYANSCAEKAFFEVRYKYPNYNLDNFSLDFSDGNCQISNYYKNADATQVLIQISGQVNNFGAISKIELLIDTSFSEVKVNKWQEVADFSPGW
ncbi:MAG: hypothetical protein CEN89_713 [Candidatus Berkelbacteria bacterium Licking1014_7]|uniref:Type 4 fimbrial biogenesis protein PilX N-terminal domain-containing protein n=1 Tax=Candidatus Berkelbacteria bacterium Licking1014_7 TaxID=2017147 RepID=A0A554LHT8_9BACT|nr:MAG: hypothetical protein CEN89_713 [Candidatus Berkelbacteria bacterium Licking1014_7]